MVLFGIIATPFVLMAAFITVKIITQMIAVVYADAFSAMGFDRFRNYLNRNVL